MLKRLADLEKRLEAIEVEASRQSYLASKPIYEERAQIIKEIPGFWPAVFEEAPLEIESHVQARDLPILDHLTSLELNRFELDEDPSNGDPRSIQLTFRFSANEYFEDETLKKKFWYRRSNDGWSGLVSEPLDIQWKDGKDPTDGLLKSAVERYHKVRETEDNLRMQAKKNAPKPSMQPQGEEVSIFAWFGYHGRDISAQEYSRAAGDEMERRETIVVGEEQEVSKAGNDGELIIEKTLAVDRDAEYPSCQETFPGGEELAIAISEDLFPGALKYFGSHSPGNSVRANLATVQYREREPSDSEDETSDGSDGHVSSDDDLDEGPASKRVKRTE